MQEQLQFLSVPTISPYFFLFESMCNKMEGRNENSCFLLEWNSGYHPKKNHRWMGGFFFHSRTLHLDIVEVFTYQLMHKRVALKEC